MNIKKILLIIMMITFLTNISEAIMINSTGKAVIESNNLKEANNDSLNNALINAIYNYYSSYQIGSSTPDITEKYIKFIKNYQIISSEIKGFTVYTNITAEVDALALKDAHILINNPSNSAVFAFTGLPNNEKFNKNQVYNIINKVLISKNFSTLESKDFIYNINNMNNFNQVLLNFEKSNAKNLFYFNFDFNIANVDSLEYKCELTTITDIISKTDINKKLKLKLSSLEKNCIEELIQSSVLATLDYIRNNIIQSPENSNDIQIYKINIINFKNVANLNKLLLDLKDRGFINAYKATNFSPKELIYEVETLFSKESMIEKISGLLQDQTFSYKIKSKSIILDFAESSEN